MLPGCREAPYAFSAQLGKGGCAVGPAEGAHYNVLDRGSLPESKYRLKARRLLQKLGEVGEVLPSTLFITGVNDHDEHPTFGGGFGDVYRASYDGKPVALKRIRTLTSEATSQRSRLGWVKGTQVPQIVASVTQHCRIGGRIDASSAASPPNRCILPRTTDCLYILIRKVGLSQFQAKVGYAGPEKMPQIDASLAHH
ncbi:hypothetical protein C8R43DRAFT_941238 [Mycena crocata]|nr:hypothetical protein C8R43DRAFT_941238 [Mycena crocata]